MDFKNIPLLVVFSILSIICLSFVIPAPASVMAAEITGDKALYAYGIDTTTKYAYTARALYAYSTLITQESSTSLSASKARGYRKENRSFAQPPPQSLCLFTSQTPAVKTTIATNWMLQNTPIQMQHDADYPLTNRNGTGLFQYRSSEEENDHGFIISQQQETPVGVFFLLFLIWDVWGVFS